MKPEYKNNKRNNNNNTITKDGHTMFLEDVAKDLKYLQNNQKIECPWDMFRRIKTEYGWYEFSEAFCNYSKCDRNYCNGGIKNVAGCLINHPKEKAVEIMADVEKVLMK